MKRLTSIFLPHERNNHHPHLLRHYSLLPLIIGFVLLQVNLALFHSTAPNVLSFATSIYKDDFYTLVNDERVQEGLDPVVENSSLNQAARAKAEHMFSHDYWAHVAPDGTTPWDFFAEVNYDYTYAGENLAKDFNTSAGVVAGWMASPSHRSNLLNPEFEEMGIAVVNGVLDGEETTLVVQLFGTPYQTVVATTFSEPEKVTEPVVEPQPQEVPAPAPIVVDPSELTSPQTVPEVVPQEPEPEVVLKPQSVFSVSKIDEQYKPQGISAQIHSGWENLKTNVVVSAQPQSWSISQEVAILFFLGLMIVLLGDTITLWQKGVRRSNSHSFMHAGILGLLLILTIVSSSGMVL